MSFWKELLGGGSKPSVEPRFNEFRKAAEQGLAQAQYNLGVCYEYGKGVKKDLREAVKWYRKAAEQGLAQAQYALGISYAQGEGVEQDPHEAVRWYRKAAEQGLAQAQFNLGFSYGDGDGVEKDLREAVKWFRKAAEQGDAKAQCRLHYCYITGEGVEKDLGEAVIWLRKAAEQGDAVAKKAWEGMSDEERREVKRREVMETLEGMRGKGLAATGSARQTVPCSECGDWRGMVPYYKCPKCSTDVTFSLNDVYQFSKLHIRCANCHTIVHIPQSVLCKKCGKGLSGEWQKRIVVTGTPAYEDQKEDWRCPGMGDLARELREQHGPMKSLSCCSGFPDFKMILEFYDGTKLESGARTDVFDRTGKFDIHRMAFGYHGTGPSCLKRFLKEFGITMADDQIAKFKPGNVVDFDRSGSFSVRTDDLIVEKS
jgi:TPR repeat protein